MGEIARTFRVDRYTVVLSVGEPVDGAPLDVRIEWSPARPPHLTKRLLRLYWCRLEAAIESLSEELADLAADRGLGVYPNPARRLH
jgi:hypothetical protein